jgi:TM2 domain-containing membrane protein YozV
MRNVEDGYDDGWMRASHPAISLEVRHMSKKRILPAFLLCFFAGPFGGHRYYVGKVGSGLLQLVTLGGVGVWALIDLIMIAVGKFTDSEGKTITEWT